MSRWRLIWNNSWLYQFERAADGFRVRLEWIEDWAKWAIWIDGEHVGNDVTVFAALEKAAELRRRMAVGRL